MTEYTLPDKGTRPEPEQDKLLHRPLPDQDLARTTTWKDVEPTETATPPAERTGRETLGQHLGKLVLRTGKTGERRDMFIVSYRWVPYSLNEATIALRKLPHYVATASRTTRGSGERAVEETFNRIDGFRAEAVQTVMGLREALWTLDEDDMNPSPDAIKGNLHVRGLLTEYLWAKDSLGKFSWSPRRAKHGPNMRRKDRLDELGKLIEEADDDTRVQLWREALVANRLRLDFWRKQVDLLKTEEASPPTEEELQLGVREARAMLDRFTERVDREGQEPTQSSGTESL